GSAVDSAVRSAVYSAGYAFYGGSLWAGYAAWADYFNEVLSVAIDRNCLDLIESCGFTWLLDGICFASERPTQIHLDDRGLLHSESTQSLGYRSGWGLWHWHGVQVTQRVIEQPSTITVKDIQEETNAEVRRVMVERYGLSRYLADSGAALLHEDEMGQLYQAEIPGDEPLVMVKVMNSTPEPDGQFKAYFLRVHPELRPLRPRCNEFCFGKQECEHVLLGDPQKLTATNAVASLHGMTGPQYANHLLQQT
ncbi:MAG: DUF6745 domain-containing protein, partial [Terriglobales bacterium]